MRRREPVWLPFVRVGVGFVIGLLVGYFLFSRSTQPISEPITPGVIAPPEIQVAISPIVRNAFGEYTEITLMVISDTKPRRGRILFFSEAVNEEFPLSVRSLPVRSLEVGLWKTIPIGVVSFEPDLTITKIVIVLE